MPDALSPRFAYFSYDRQHRDGYVNLGDAMQTLAACRLFGPPERFVERDNMASATSSSPCLLVANGNISEEVPAGSWPGQGITPLFLGAQFSNHLLDTGFLTKLRTCGEVGARDTDTHRRLTALGAKSCLTGCLTLSLSSPVVPRSRTIIVDVLPEMIAAMPAELVADAFMLSHIHVTGAPVDVCRVDPISRTVTSPLTPQECAVLFAGGRQWNAALNAADLTPGNASTLAAGLMPRGGFAESDRRILHEMIQADSLLRLYASAELVVTARLHVALPCLAIGTPVVLVTSMTAYAPERMDPYEWFMRRWLVREFREIDWRPRPPNLAAFSGLLRRYAQNAVGEAWSRIEAS